MRNVTRPSCRQWKNGRNHCRERECCGLSPSGADDRDRCDAHGVNSDQGQEGFGVALTVIGNAAGHFVSIVSDGSGRLISTGNPTGHEWSSELAAGVASVSKPKHESWCPKPL